MASPDAIERFQVVVDRVLMTDQGGVVLLRSDREPFADKVLPVFVDIGQAVNIQMGRTDDLPPRPFTHDLITTILNELGALVVSLNIDDLAQNTFFATLQIEADHGKESRVERFDARPSDGIALALRADAPIYVSRKVLEQASVSPDEFFVEDDEEDEGGPPVIIEVGDPESYKDPENDPLLEESLEDDPVVADPQDDDDEADQDDDTDDKGPDGDDDSADGDDDEGGGIVVR